MPKKLVIIGDSGSGKTSLLNVLVHGSFPKHDPPPNISENQIAGFEFDGKRVEFALWDVSTKHGYDEISGCADADVILVCFSIMNPASFTSVKEKWFMKVLECASDTPTILVGCKKDLTNDAEAPTKAWQGKAIAKNYLASHYMECSAKTGEGVHDLFRTAANLALHEEKSKPEGGKCTIL